MPALPSRMALELGETNPARRRALDWSAARTVVLALAVLAFVAEGIATQVMGLAAPAILASWSIPRAALATPTALGLVGFALGAVAGGVAGDRLGQARALTASLLLMGACTAGCALAQNVSQLCLWRLLAGIGLGGSLPIAATVLANTAPARQRSLALAVGLAFLPLGGSAAGLAAALITPTFGWRALFAAGGAVAVVLALAAGLASARPAVSAVVRAGEGSSGGNAYQRGEPFARQLQWLLAPQARRDTLAVWVAFFCTVLVYYSMFSWAPTALTKEGMGLAAASRAVAGFSVGGLFGGLLAGVLVQRLGSRPCFWLFGCTALCSAILLPQLSHAAGHGSALSVAIGLLGAGIIGLQTLLYALGAHLYPAERRSTSLGLAVGWGRLGAIVSSFSGVAALDLGGMPGFFGSIAVGAALVLAAGLLVKAQMPAP